MPTVPRRSDHPSPPAEAELSGLLGSARPHWDALLAAAVKADASCRVEWVYYKSLKGWRCIVKLGGRAVVHLRPDEGGFLASFALSDEAIDAAARAGVERPVIAAARAAKLLPEGRPVRLQVQSAKELRTAVELLRAKLGGLIE